MAPPAPTAIKAPTARRTPSAPRVKLRRTLRTVRWARADAYKNDPQKRKTLEKAVERFMENRKDELRRLNVVEAVIKGLLQNNPLKPDKKGDHLTVEMRDEDGQVVTKKHVYIKKDGK
ncbi:hypothetical protein E4U54_000371 [Claviceps lovelessii]|nr:hypothetical protein E4U54_000371 [Claviceps lovelessii]